MELNNYIVSKYIGYFFSRIVGFKNQNIQYVSMSHESREFLSIAMDKIDRLTRKSGRLRNRVWSNCYFVFHGSEIEPSKIYENKVKEIKKAFPFLFVRSYIYFVFIDISKGKQSTLLGDKFDDIETKYYKIWLFNSKYEVQEETKRTNLFGITLDENEVIDDYIYLANPDSELQRIKASNSDAIDCVRAFIGDLELLEQTSNMLNAVNKEYKENSGARIIVEGPARSGKTIIAATLLGQYEDSKFLLMNYFFYQAIVDGFHALSGWDAKEIEELVKNPELDLWLNIKKKMPKLLERINENLKYAINECDRPKNGTKTKQWLMENISELTEGFEKSDFENKGLPIFKSLMNLNTLLAEADGDRPFVHIEKSKLIRLKEIIEKITSGEIENLQLLIAKVIEELIVNSKQKFFHHNINKNISSKVTDGCWIERGTTTAPKMWTESYHPQLIICDEVQRLGLISKYRHFDEFDEVKQILSHSKQSFFTGDNFQMLNSKYDQGIERITSEIKRQGQSLTIHKLPDSVGVPAEIGILMKYLTNPNATDVGEVIKNWKTEKNFEIIFINQNVNQLIGLFDIDASNKKHLASPMDYDWLDYNEIIKIDTCHRKTPIISLQGHEKDNFAYKFPYFCNEEIMPNYILSAYELISREVESLYVHIPKFKKMGPQHEDWYRKHLYVLFTRPTSRLVVNFSVDEEFCQINNMIQLIKENGANVSVVFLGNEMII